MKKRSIKAGLSPGTLVHVGAPPTIPTRIFLTRYCSTGLQECEIQNIAEAFPLHDPGCITWINIEGTHHPEIVRAIGEHVGLHPLLQEDILNMDQRPKVEDNHENIFLVLKMLSYDLNKFEIITEQVSLVLQNRLVITFQEGREGDVFDAIRKRLRNDHGRHRTLGADYLAYSLLDAIVDNYFVILENLGERIETLEQELITNFPADASRLIHHYKRQMIQLRRSVWPLREMLGILYRGESKLIEKHTTVFLRDVYDHSVSVIETIEAYRDILSELVNIYLSSLSNRMNQVMKVLTIFASIFMPLTFIVGVYGMNFEFMPELKLKWAYPAVWAIMIATTMGMIFYFRRKKWV